ncbi:MAG: serine/threonine-protein phosphatase [Acidobacteria bacterium]|nr:serine/threonine-protein phosphatase [Acidobacteriota bacterium]
MIESFGLTNPGCVRKNNEDYYILAPEVGLYVVADGMGGAQAGEHASKLAAETVLETVLAADQLGSAVLLKAFEEANRQVLEAAHSDVSLEGMGTTLVAVLDCAEGLLVASVGDSRAYIYENDELLIITEDQTWVHEVGRRLGLDEATLKNHPMRHVLTMAIGVSAQLRVHTYALKPLPGTQILLCSDGLHGVVGEDVIFEALSTPGELEQKCSFLVDSARAAGGPDNITTILLRMAAA